MRIGQLADRLGINSKTIRYYEDIGLMPPARRTAAGYRDYDDVDVSRVGFIKTAKRLGLSLEEISEILSLRERGEAPCSYVRDAISQQLRSIDKRIAELRSLRRELRHLDAAAEALPEVQGATCRIIEHMEVVGQRPPDGGSATEG
jgi:DNA-binding transcriptional MerR regulator